MATKIKTAQHAVIVLRSLRISPKDVQAATGISSSTLTQLANGLRRPRSKESDDALIAYAQQYVPQLDDADFTKILYLLGRK